MNDKIKEALGEKAEEIEAIMKKAGIELAVANDGSVVPASKHDATKAEAEKLQRLVKEFQDAETKKKDDEEKTKAEKEREKQTLEQKLEDMRKEFNDYKTNVETEKTNNAKAQALEKALKDEKCNPSAIKYIINSTNLSKVELENGEAPKEWVEGLKNETPTLFGVESTESTRTPPDKTKTQEKPKYTKEEIDNMSQEEVAADLDNVLASLKE